MGRSDYGTCTQCIRFTFIGCNCFFVVLSVIGFAIGIWTIATANNNDYDSATGSSTVSSGAILLTSSIISFGLCVTGIIGGIFMWRPFLIIYAIVLGIIVILEFISAILAFVYADNAREIIRDNFEDAIEDYRVDEDDDDYNEGLNEDVEAIQETLECCGINNASDWIRLNPEAVADNGGVPPGKCTCDPGEDDDCVEFFNSGEYVWEDGCLDTLELFVSAYSIAVGVVSLLVMIIEILFVVVAVCLTVTITKTRGRDTVI